MFSNFIRLFEKVGRKRVKFDKETNVFVNQNGKIKLGLLALQSECVRKEFYER